MELKNLVQRYAYRIEPKPEGGFIARPSDPTVPALEAPTREELQQKIQAKLLAELGEKFPGLKLPAFENKQVKWEVHIDRKPGGGFSVHSDEPGGPALDPATHEKIDHFAEELLGFVDKNFPQLSQAIASQAGTGDIKVFTNTTTVSSRSIKTSATLNGLQALSPTSTTPAAGPQSVEASATQGTTLTQNGISSAPILPETNSNWKTFLILVGAMLVAVMIYFFFYRG